MRHDITPELAALFTRKAEGMGFTIRKKSNIPHLVFDHEQDSQQDLEV